MILRQIFLLYLINQSRGKKIICILNLRFTDEVISAVLNALPDPHLFENYRFENCSAR